MLPADTKPRAPRHRSPGGERHGKRKLSTIGTFKSNSGGTSERRGGGLFRTHRYHLELNCPPPPQPLCSSESSHRRKQHAYACARERRTQREGGREMGGGGGGARERERERQRQTETERQTEREMRKERERGRHRPACPSLLYTLPGMGSGQESTGRV